MKKTDFLIIGPILIGGIIVCSILYYRAPIVAKQFELPDPPVLMTGSDTLNVIYTAIELHPKFPGEFVSCNDTLPKVKNPEKYHLIVRDVSSNLLVCGWSH